MCMNVGLCFVQIQMVRAVNVRHVVVTTDEITGVLDEKDWRLLLYLIYAIIKHHSRSTVSVFFLTNIIVFDIT